MNRLHVLFFSLAMVLFTSCQFSEHVYLNADGSGRMEFKFDGSELMQMGGEGMLENSKKKNIDSTFSFKDVFKDKQDSISKLPKEQQAKLKAMENFKVHMLVNSETKAFNMEFITDFKKASELKDMFAAMNVMSDLEGKSSTSKNPANPIASMGDFENWETSFSFKKGVFKRHVEVLDKEAQETSADSLKGAAFMFANSKYKVNYHLPKRVKSVSNDKALFSADGKTVIIEYGILDYFTNPEVMNLEIVLED